MSALANQVTSVMLVEPSAGDVVDVLGEVATFKVSSADSGGSLIMAEIVTQPGGGPHGLHTHPTEEAFYVLEGEFEMTGLDHNGEPFVVRAVAGSVVYVPSNAAHTFKNVGKAPGRLLVIYTSPELERMARELAAVAAAANPEAPLDPNTIVGILTKHGVRFVAPDHA